MSRYDRQIQLPEIGPEGQKKLAKARVLLIGVGGLGSPAALYLAAAGVGQLGLVDDDVVSLSNLQRQILFETAAQGQKKVSEAARRLRNLNPEIRVNEHDVALSAANALELFGQYDIVVDGTDNFKTRYLISKACLETGKPHIYGGIFKFEGHVAIFEPNQTACYRCLFTEVPRSDEIPNCSEAGVLGALPGIIGSTQALEVLKLILGLAKPGSLFVFDALHLESRNLCVDRKPDCPHCGVNAQSFKELYASDSIDELQNRKQILTTDEFNSHGLTHAVWIDVRSENEFATSHKPGARNIPISRLADELATLDRRQTYVVYCASGQRSLAAQDLLLRQGFADVWNLRPGLGF